MAGAPVSIRIGCKYPKNKKAQKTAKNMVKNNLPGVMHGLKLMVKSDQGIHVVCRVFSYCSPKHLPMNGVAQNKYILSFTS